jgi:hypothetical protein
MRSSIFPTLAFLVLGATSHPSDFSPFYPAVSDSVDLSTSSNDTISPLESAEELFRRAGNCPSNYNSCSTLAAGDAGACCTAGSVCSWDSNNVVACCPTGAYCTGTISLPTAVSTTTSGAIIIAGSTTTTTGVSSTTTTGSSTAGVITATGTGTVTYVPNVYFSWPYLPTSYVNAAACTSAYSVCQTEYAACTQDLQGGSFAVTIDSPNGGVTVGGGTGTYSLGAAQATSVCKSLSQEACWGIQTSNCAQFGSGTDTTTTATATTTGSFIIGNEAVRGRGCLGAVVAGVGMGIMGGMV